MARRTKAQEEMLENQRKMTEIKEEELELLPTGTSPEQETSQENTEERTNIDNIVTEEELEQTTNVKVKEIKYGFSVLTNIELRCNVLHPTSCTSLPKQEQDG